jgi:hypothetical protein
MENVKYEGVYPCIHNHSTIIFSLLQGEKFMDFLFFNSQMDEETESRSER